MNKYLKMVSVLLLVCVIFSCKKAKQDKPVDDPDAKPVVVARGTLNGSPVEKTIGPAGGSLEVPDGTMHITIPAGAVDAETSFSIQPVTNTLGKNGLGTSYRLLPENIKFKKDIEISFKYNAEMVNGAAEDFLYLAYHDADGFWHSANRTQLDKVNKTLTVKTRHFSDWIVYTLVKLWNMGKEKLNINEETVLEVNAYKFMDMDLEDSYLPNTTKVTQNDIENWQVVAGVGVIAPNLGTTANFKAPSIISDPGSSKIQVKVKGIKNLRGITGDAYAYVDVQLVPDEYLIWEIDGERFFATGAGAPVAKYTADRANLYTIGRGPARSFSLDIGGTNIKTYKFGPFEEFVRGFSRVSSGDLITNSVYDVYKSSTACGGPVVYSEGEVKVTSVTDYFEGTAEGVLFQTNIVCGITRKKLKANFRVKIQN